VDHGYATKATYLFAEKLIGNLKLDTHIYTPKLTSGRREALMDGIPDIDDELHKEFTRQVKLEPFRQALEELKPEIWITGIRREQTEFRKSLDIVTEDAGGVLKVAPVFYWTETDMEGYLYENSLPREDDYHDPTKVLENRECGLHTSLDEWSPII